MTNPVLCSICHRTVLSEEPRYRFPTLPAGHGLMHFAGIAHVECLRREDQKFSFGTQLTDIRESVARTDPLGGYVRDGNVILSGRLAKERMLELYDAENFCDFTLTESAALKFMRGELDRVETPLHVLASEEDKLIVRNQYPPFTLELGTLTRNRFKALLRKFFQAPTS